MFFQRLPFLGWFASQGVRVELGHGHQPQDDWPYVSDTLPRPQVKTRHIHFGEGSTLARIGDSGGQSIRECFRRVVYSHKTQEKCADILLSRSATIKLWRIILSAVTVVGFTAAMFGVGKAGAAIGTVVSVSLLVLNAYTKNYDLGELSQKHKQAANDLWIIREKDRSLITDLRMGEKPIEILQKVRDALLDDLHAVYERAPSTTFQAYREAQEALKRFEDMASSEQEIDAFLPQELKRSR